VAGATNYPRLTAAGDSANDAFLDAITAAVDTFDAYVAKVNDAATILAGDNTTFKMQGLNGPAVAGATRTVKLLGRPDSEHAVFLEALNAICATFGAYRTAINANAAIVGGDTTCYKVQALNGPAVSGATVFYRSDSRTDTDLDDTETQINAMVEALSQLASGWNLKQGGTPTTLVVSSVKRLRPMQRPSTGGGDTGDPSTRFIAVDGGDAQSATVAGQPATALTVEVTDGTGSVVSGESVSWAIDGDGTITTSSLSNASGIASATPLIGTLVGDYTVTASLSTGSSVTFTVTGTADVAALLSAISTTDQSGTTSAPVAAPPSVRVTDVYGNPVSGTTVTFAVTAGGGSRSPGTVASDTNGVATLTSWTLGASAGANTLTATVAGLGGSPVTFTANGTASAPTQIAVQSGGSQTGVTAGNAATATVFRVRDGSNNAVQGVTVSFETTGTGSLSVASAVTNASGDASVTLTTGTTVETATVTASFVNASAATVSTSTTIASTFGAKNKLAIQTQPSSSGSSGTALSQQPILLIQDANGNTVTNATDTVTAAVQSGNASITAGSTKAAVAGVATFSGLTLTDVDSGTNILRFSSGALTVVDSTGTVLAPPVPVALQFAGPITGAVENIASLAATVHVVDGSNVIVPGATNAVTLALTTPGGATLSGTLTANAASGVASFSGMAVDTAGTYTFTATASGLTSATSGSFTITSASGADPYEPAGYSQIAYRPFTTNDEDGWSPVISAGVIRTDATAPTTPSGVLRFNKTNDGATSFSPGRFDKTVSKRTGVYWRCAVKLSAGFLANTSQVNKVGPFFGLEGGVQMFLNAHGDTTTTGPMYWRMRAQGCPPSLGPISASGDANMGGNTSLLVRDRWYIVRGQMVCNTYNVADGILKLWTTDTTTGVTTQVLNRTNMAYIGSGTIPATNSSSGFDRVFLNAIHGGGAENPGADTNIYIDDYYVSAP
jgi:hypothetical protein